LDSNVWGLPKDEVVVRMHGFCVEDVGRVWAPVAEMLNNEECDLDALSGVDVDEDVEEDGF
jgi:hypothetical protein